MNDITCPHCGESYYAEVDAICTAVGWMPVYKDGVLLNRNPNTMTITCHCLNCDKDFVYSRNSSGKVRVFK